MTLRARSMLLAVVGALAAALAIWLLARDAESQPAPQSPEATVAPPARGGERARPLALDVPRGGHPIVWVRAGERAAIRTRPGGGEVAAVVGRKTEFDSPTVFGVQREVKGWAGVTTAELPNNRLGWIRLDGERLRAGWVEDEILVDISDRRAELREAGKPVRSFTVTVGAPGADTPTGRFAVTDTFRGDLLPAYGCCAVAISANQPHVPSGWLGGSRIAFHGTDGPLGVAASHGCVRAGDSDVDLLVDRVPLGTPVVIRE